MPSGMGGSLGLPGAPPNDSLDVQEWSIEKTCDAQEITDTGSLGNKEYEAGNRGWSGRCTTVWDPNKMVDTDLALDTGDDAVVEFALGTTGKSYSGTIIVTGVSTRNPAVGDTVIRQDITYQGTGPLTNPITA